MNVCESGRTHLAELLQALQEVQVLLLGPCHACTPRVCSASRAHPISQPRQPLRAPSLTFLALSSLRELAVVRRLVGLLGGLPAAPVGMDTGPAVVPGPRARGAAPRHFSPTAAAACPSAGDSTSQEPKQRGRNYFGYPLSTEASFGRSLEGQASGYWRSLPLGAIFPG